MRMGNNVPRPAANTLQGPKMTKQHSSTPGNAVRYHIAVSNRKINTRHTAEHGHTPPSVPSFPVPIGHNVASHVCAHVRVATSDSTINPRSQSGELSRGAR